MPYAISNPTPLRFGDYSTPYAIRNPLWPMVVVLLIAAAFRFAAIGDAPPGWRDDELIEFDLDRRIVEGWRPLFIAEAEGHEPFYHYLHAGTIALFGENMIGYKWLPFALGCLSVALTFALARRLFDPRVALLAASLTAVAFWPIMYARLGLRHVGILPPMLGAFLALYPRISFTADAKRAKDAEKNFDKLRVLRALGGHMLAGVLLAAALMTYFAGRALPLILVGFLAYLLVLHRPVLRRVWPGYAGAIAIGVLIAAPMFAEIARTPGAEKRTEVVGGPLSAALRGDLRPALETTRGTLGMFTFAGDPESLYNLPGRPVFDGLSGAAFYLGVLLCVARLKQTGAGFALVWLVVGIAPAFVSLPAASFSHTLAAQPVVYMVTAYGTLEIGMWISDKVTRWQSDRPFTLSPLHFVTLSLVLLNSFLTIRDYFGAWAHDPFVRFQYHGPTRDLARWLDQHPDVTSVAVGTHPNLLYLDPLALELDLMREDVQARWFNPARSLVLPPKGVVLISPMQPASPDIQNELTLAGFHEHLSGPDRTAGLDIYHVNRSTKWLKPFTVFDGSIGLLHFETLPPGDEFSRRTLWQIAKSNPIPRLTLFFHVLDEQNQVVVGDDRSDIDISTLLPGDWLIQYNKFALPTDLAPGQYQVEVGWYDLETGVRLQVSDGGDRVLLDPIAVAAP